MESQSISDPPWCWVRVRSQSNEFEIEFEMRLCLVAAAVSPIYYWLLVLGTNSAVSASAVSEPRRAPPTSSECQAAYGTRDFIETSKMWDRGMPYLLLSFPGSGNTWVRLLLEFATGFYSSTIYGGGGPYGRDAELREVFHAEDKCGLRTIIIKAHPEDLVLSPGGADMPPPGPHKDTLQGHTRLRSPNKHVRRKCGRSLIHYWDKVLLLTRDPYRAILSDYQRMVTTSHTGHYSSLSSSLADPDTPASTTSSPSQPARPKLTAQQFWVDMAITKAEFFRQKMDTVIYPLLSRQGPGALLPFAHPEHPVALGVVRYEDLTNASTRVDALTRAVQMLNVTTFRDRRRMECAFVLADDPRIRRGYNASAASSSSSAASSSSSSRRSSSDSGGGGGEKSKERGSSSASFALSYRGVQANLTEVLWEQLRGFAGNFSYEKPTF